MQKSPDLSIVIPTKNRQYYCLKAIEQVLSLELEGIEVIVQDNSDDDTLASSIYNLNDTRVIYNYHSGALSFVDNFSEALRLCKGEYVCMIGDDDGILPNIMKWVGFAIRNNYDAIIPGLNAVYIWPNEHPFVKGAENGYLCVKYISKKLIDVDPKSGLIHLLEQAGQGYQSLDVPRIYHGIVKRIVILEAEKRTGKLFDGLSPDIYMSAILCLLCNKVCRIDLPFTLSGICKGSGSSNSATGQHTGYLKDAPHFIGHADYKWDERVPYIYTVETIWAETLLHALSNMKAYEFEAFFNIGRLDSMCILKYPQFKKKLIEHMEKYNINRTLGVVQAYKEKYAVLLKKILYRVLYGDVHRYYNILTIDDAVIKTSNYL